jgi:hypothetical protein
MRYRRRDIKRLFAYSSIEHRAMCPTAKKIADFVSECMVMCRRPANFASGPPMPNAKVTTALNALARSVSTSFGYTRFGDGSPRLAARESSDTSIFVRLAGT